MIICGEEPARDYVASLCDSAAMARLERLAEMLSVENARQNLVAQGSIGHIWQRHIADSAQLFRFVSRETGPWMDLGTGAGFPGLVLAAIRPEGSFLVVESRKKRAEWLQYCVSELSLNRCEVLGQRLERIDSFPVATLSARAFAPLVDTIHLGARFSSDETQWVLPKGRGAALELESLPLHQRQLFHVEPSLTDGDAGIIVGRLAAVAQARKPRAKS